MVQPQNFFLFLIFLVAPCGTAAPVLFQWLVNRDVSTGAPSSNGTIIPILTSPLLVSVLIHSRGFMRSLDEAKRIVSIRAARPVLHIIERSSPKKIQYFFLDEKALSILLFLRQFLSSLSVKQSPALCFVGQYFGFAVSNKTKFGTLADSVRALRALSLFFHFIIIKFMGDFSYLESFCGVLCFYLFRTFFLSFHHRRNRLASYKFSFFVFHKQRRRKLIVSLLGRNNLNWSRCFLVRTSSSRLMTVGRDFRKAPVSMRISHGGVRIFIMGVILSNAKKIQFTGKTPLGSELHMGKVVRSTLRGIDRLHGPTFHSICGNSIIYKPSNPLMFEHDGSRPALLQSRPPGGAELSANGRGFSSLPMEEGNSFGPPRGRRPAAEMGRFPHTSLPLRKKGFTVLDNSFLHWLTMFPEKRFYLSNRETSTTKVAIHTNLFTDLYALIGIGSFETGWYTTVIKPPFIFCIWIGFIMASLGGSFSPFRKLTFYRLDWNQKFIVGVGYFCFLILWI